MAFKPEFQTEFEMYEQKLDKAINHLKTEFSLVRAGRANPQVLSKITVDYYGTPTPLQQMANITVPEARMLLITLYDKGMLKAVEKEILASNLGITPQNDGTQIRLIFPALTADRRKELSKQIKTTCENSKVVLRNERRDAMEVIKRLKKDNIITEDEEKQYGIEVQKLLDKKIESADKMLKEKESEILEV